MLQKGLEPTLMTPQHLQNLRSLKSELFVHRTQKRGLKRLKTFPTPGIRRTKDENRFRDVKKVQEREKRAFCPQKEKKEGIKEEAKPKNWKNTRRLKSEQTKIIIITQKRSFL